MGIFGIHVNLNSTAGVYLIGTFISNILLGATCVQMYIYFRSYQDSFLTKAKVLCLLVLELLHGALSMQVLYHFLVTNYMDPLALRNSIWAANISFTVTGAIILVVHLSYAVRIYYVSGKQLLVPIVILILSLLVFALGISLSVELFIDPNLFNLSGIRETLAKAALVIAAFDDFLIAGSLTFNLKRARTGFKRTDKVIDKLMMYAVNNGILTSVADIVALAFVFAFPNDMYSVAISQIIGNLYSNSLMATFNSRKKQAKALEPSSFEFNSGVLSTFGVAANPQLRSKVAPRSFSSSDSSEVPDPESQNYTQTSIMPDEESM